MKYLSISNWEKIYIAVWEYLEFVKNSSKSDRLKVFNHMIAMKKIKWETADQKPVFENVGDRAYAISKSCGLNSDFPSKVQEIKKADIKKKFVIQEWLGFVDYDFCNDTLQSAFDQIIPEHVPVVLQEM